MFSKLTKATALVLALIMCAVLFVGCGGGGISNGTYIPDDSGLFSSAPYSSLSFSGSKVTIGMLGGVMSYDKIPYTYKDGTFSFELAGMNVDLPCKVIDNKSFELAGTLYTKK
ncbi:MAG: hypothetical protein LBN02_05240 [Oscillospiraceae bacterium]|jgi:hypothetical protein|nr:hypothetical protein [Oscillospiraceae bacterium]